MEDTHLVNPRIRDLFSYKNLSSILSDKQEKNLTGGGCGSILFNPVQCSSGKTIVGGLGYENFAKETGSCPNMGRGPSNPIAYSICNDELFNLRFNGNNRSHGGTKSILFKDVLNHNKEGPFQFVKGSAYDKGLTTILRSNKELHEKHCPYVSVEGTFGTEFPIRRINIDKHYNVEGKSAEQGEECHTYFDKSKRQYHKGVSSLKSQIDVLNDRFISQQKDYESVSLIRRIEIHKLNHDK